jgi:hypothetical protein
MADRLFGPTVPSCPGQSYAGVRGCNPRAEANFAVHEITSLRIEIMRALENRRVPCRGACCPPTTPALPSIIFHPSDALPNRSLMSRAIVCRNIGVHVITSLRSEIMRARENRRGPCGGACGPPVPPHMRLVRGRASTPACPSIMFYRQMLRPPPPRISRGNRVQESGGKSPRADAGAV